MVATFLTNRLAAKAGTRAADLTLHADAAGDACTRIVERAWRDLWRGMKPGPHLYQANARHADAVLQKMAADLWQTLHRRLAGMIEWSHEAAVGAMLGTLPKDYLRAAVATRLQESRDASSGLLTLRARSSGREIPSAEQPRALHALGTMPADRATDIDANGRDRRILEAGALAFGLYTPWNRPAEFTVTDFAEPLRAEPAFPFGANPPSLSPEEERALFASLLFPPPSAEQVRGILDNLLPARSWLTTVGTGRTSRSTLDLAATIAGQYASGASTREVATAIRGYFDGSAMRATRTARTLGAFVGTERQLAVDDGMGDLIEGYIVHSAGGHNARHNHALRSGTMYFKRPTGSQYGVDVMPHPPIDTGHGPYDEKKPQTGPNQVTCYNCRCWVTPILRPLPAMQTPAFLDNAAKLIPDPAHFADWWETANPQQKIAAAGARRLDVARAALQREPSWADLVNPQTGQLMAVATLKREHHLDRTVRVAKVNAVIRRNREAVQRVAAFGSA